MISTTPKGTDQLDIEPWFAQMLFAQCERPSVFARLMFTTPEKLTKRLAMGGKHALTTARQVAAVDWYIKKNGWPE